MGGIKAPSTPYVYGYQPQNHWMVLLGYKQVSAQEAGGNPNLIGKTRWFFKNSYGNESPPEWDIIFNNNDYWDRVYFAEMPIISRNMTDADIICEDNDGDGYFYWGISENPPIALPSWAHTEKDGDDSNFRDGPMNQYGENQPLSPNINSWNIQSTVLFEEDMMWDRYVEIKNGGTVIIKKEVHCLPGTCWYVESGGTLIIRGGKLINPFITISSGANVIIEDNGELVYMLEDNDILEFPITSSLEITNGIITKSKIEW